MPSPLLAHYSVFFLMAPFHCSGCCVCAHICTCMWLCFGKNWFWNVKIHTGPNVELIAMYLLSHWPTDSKWEQRPCLEAPKTVFWIIPEHQNFTLKVKKPLLFSGLLKVLINQVYWLVLLSRDIFCSDLAVQYRMERGHGLAQLGKIWRAIPLFLYSRLVPEDVITSPKSELSLRKPRPCWYLAAASLGSPLLQPKEPPRPKGRSFSGAAKVWARGTGVSKPLPGWTHHSGFVPGLQPWFTSAPRWRPTWKSIVWLSQGFFTNIYLGKKEEIRWRGQADGWEGERETECKHVWVRTREKSHRF